MGIERAREYDTRKSDLIGIDGGKKKENQKFKNKKKTNLFSKFMPRRSIWKGSFVDAFLLR